MAGERTENARIIVAFGDMTDFTSFEQSVTNPEVEFDPLFKEYDALIDNTERLTGYHLTDTGDGFLCTVDLDSGHVGGVASNVLVNLWRLLKKIQRLIDQKDPPRPEGFRIRMACGYVRRKVKRNGRVVLRGRHINLAHHLLDVGKMVPFLVHDSVKQLLKKSEIRRAGLLFRKYVPDESDYTRVSSHHANALWHFRTGRKLN